MFRILLKHYIYELCIDTFFSVIYKNFVIPKIIERYSRGTHLKWSLDTQQGLMNSSIGCEAINEIQKTIDDEIIEVLLAEAFAEGFKQKDFGNYKYLDIEREFDMDYHR